MVIYIAVPNKNRVTDAVLFTVSFSGKNADPILVSMKEYMAPCSTPKIQVVAAKPNLLAQLAGGSSSPKPVADKAAEKPVDKPVVK